MHLFGGMGKKPLTGVLCRGKEGFEHEKAKGPNAAGISKDAASVNLLFVNTTSKRHAPNLGRYAAWMWDWR